MTSVVTDNNNNNNNQDDQEIDKGSDALKKEIERLKKENEKLKEASIFVEMLKQVTENDEKAALIEALKDKSRELINIGTQRLRIIETRRTRRIPKKRGQT